MLKIWKTYRRNEIAAELGGSTIDFLPTVNGKVVCACLKKKLNPDAPKTILAGLGWRRENSARALCKQTETIPVFIKQAVNAWEYVGNFAVEKSSTDAKEIQRQEIYANRLGRQGISRIIYLKESKSLRLRASAVNN